MANWNEIKQEWESSKNTLANLAEKLYVKHSTFKCRDGKVGNPWTWGATTKKMNPNEEGRNQG